MKIQTAFRLDKSLLDDLREQAKAENRSLNNYVESVLLKQVGLEPNEVTKRAINEVRKGKAESVGDLEEYKKRLLGEV